MEVESERSGERRPKKEEESRRLRWRDEILRFAALRLADKAFDWIMALI